MGTNQLLAGNLATLLVAVLAFLGLVPWPIAGYIILASALVATLVYLNPSRGQTSDPQKSIVSLHLTEVREKADENVERRKVKTRVRPRTLPSSASLEVESPNVAPLKPRIMPQEPPGEGNGPEAPTRIGEDDYLSFDLDLEEGGKATGEVSSSEDVNVYVLTEDNLDALDLGQEFWYEAGTEGVRNATLHFTAPEDGKWFLVVENAGNKEAFATIKLSFDKTSRSTPFLKTEGLGLPDAKLEGKL